MDQTLNHHHPHHHHHHHHLKRTPNQPCFFLLVSFASCLVPRWFKRRTQKRCPVRANKRTPHAPNDAERYILPSGGSFGWYYLRTKSTLQGINISHLGKRKIIFKMAFLGDMLVSWRVPNSPMKTYDLVRETLKTYQAGQFVVVISFDKESKHLQHLHLIISYR